MIHVNTYKTHEITQVSVVVHENVKVLTFVFNVSGAHKSHHHLLILILVSCFFFHVILAATSQGKLWEFIRDLLRNRKTCPSLICWEDYSQAKFRFVRSDEVAKLWGSRKGNTKMTYEKLSRAMRWERTIFLHLFVVCNYLNLNIIVCVFACTRVPTNRVYFL